MRWILALLATTLVAIAAGVEAPTGFDDLSNGVTDQATHATNKETFDEVEEAGEGLGPIYNAQSCRECHQNPISGGGSQVTELRAGHLVRGRFQNPAVPINHGQEVIRGRSLINDRAICPNAQEHVPKGNPVRALRISLNLLGDGFVEAIPDATLAALARANGGIALKVPILEAPGAGAIGRFGWKAQHASLLSFSADAYLNEMGITNRLLPNEITTVCQPEGVRQPNDQSNDIEKFAQFMRATKAPPRDEVLAALPEAKIGERTFRRIGCERCHVSTFTTAPAGTKINGETFTIPDTLGNKTFHPFSDFLLHNVGTGDGIGIATVEHFGAQAGYMKRSDVDLTRNRMRTAPLWGLGQRLFFLHDGRASDLIDAISAHMSQGSEANQIISAFNSLQTQQKQDLINFLRSL